MTIASGQSLISVACVPSPTGGHFYLPKRLKTIKLIDQSVDVQPGNEWFSVAIISKCFHRFAPKENKITIETFNIMPQALLQITP